MLEVGSVSVSDSVGMRGESGDMDDVVLDEQFGPNGATCGRCFLRSICVFSFRRRIIWRDGSLSMAVIGGRVVGGDGGGEAIGRIEESFSS